MTTIDITAAWSAIRTRLEQAAQAGTITVPLRFQGDPAGDLPDGEAFALVTVSAFPQFPVAFGGGRGQTRMRNPCILAVYLCTPKRWGLVDRTTEGGRIAGVLRNQSFGGVSCFAATVDPSGLAARAAEEIAGTYEVTVIDVEFRFDQTA